MKGRARRAPTADGAASGHVKTSIRNGILRVTLARPPLNILSGPMLAEIRRAVEAAGRDPAMRAVCFDAEGEAFSAGTDVRDHLPPAYDAMLSAFHAIPRALAAAGLPAIAKVDGPALGGGCELACCFCDWVFATPRARFGFPEIRLGVFPPAAAAFLPEAVGTRHATDLILTGRVVEAAEAEAMGLVTQVAEPPAIDEAIDRLCGVLRSLSADALRAARKALDRSAAFLAKAERIYRTELPRSPDMTEGLNAFLEKRPPRWRG